MIPRNMQRGPRTGLTLMELVVVLVILIALGALVIPLLPNLLTNAHDATTVTNISEINRAMVSYYMVNLKYPDEFDSLLDTSTSSLYKGLVFSPNNPGGMAATTFTTLNDPGAPAATLAPNAFKIDTLQSQEAASLVVGGIQNLWYLNPNPYTNGGSATYNAYVDTNNALVASKTNIKASTNAGVVVADPNYIYQKLNGKSSANCRYLVFALGTKCTLIGAASFGIFNAPLCFGEHDFEQPNNSYARMLVVFRVFADGTRAEYVGATHPDATFLGTTDMHLQEYYSTNKQ